MKADRPTKKKGRTKEISGRIDRLLGWADLAVVIVCATVLAGVAARCALAGGCMSP